MSGKMTWGIFNAETACGRFGSLSVDGNLWDSVSLVSIGLDGGDVAEEGFRSSACEHCLHYRDTLYTPSRSGYAGR